MIYTLQARITGSIVLSSEVLNGWRTLEEGPETLSRDSQGQKYLITILRRYLSFAILLFQWRFPDGTGLCDSAPDWMQKQENPTIFY